MLTHGGLGLLSYLIGSIPWGVWTGRWVKGIDIRDQFSGNIGATNVWRQLGPVWGVVVFLLDVGKGVLPVAVTKYWLQYDEVSVLLFGLCAAVGHAFSCWLVLQDYLENPGRKLAKGGKIIATALGVIIPLAPYLALQLAAVWLVVFLFSRMISLGSVAAAAAGILLVLASGSYSLAFSLVFIVMASYSLVKHLPNMQRVIRGEEPRVSFSKQKEERNAEV